MSTQPFQLASTFAAACLAGACTMVPHATASAEPPRDPHGLLRMLDADGDGRLDRHEVRGTPLAALFLHVDANADGCLDGCELRAEGLVRTTAPYDPADPCPTSW